MSSKTIFIIVVTILVTVILMKNTDEVNFWIFGNHSVPKLAVLGVMFGTGLVLGFLAGRPKRTKELPFSENTDDEIIHYESEENTKNWISPEDEEYIN